MSNVKCQAHGPKCKIVKSLLMFASTRKPFGGDKESEKKETSFDTLFLFYQAEFELFHRFLFLLSGAVHCFAAFVAGRIVFKYLYF